jgi:hypothetical protein
MKKSLLVCFIMTLCTSFPAAGQAPQSNGPALVESKCNSGFKECQESLSDFKEAQRFMQMKDALRADLSGMEKSRATRAKIAPVRVAVVNRPETGGTVVYGANVGTSVSSAVPATSAVQPVSLKSMVVAPANRHTP